MRFSTLVLVALSAPLAPHRVRMCARMCGCDCGCGCECECAWAALRVLALVLWSSAIIERFFISFSLRQAAFPSCNELMFVLCTFCLHLTRTRARSPSLFLSLCWNLAIRVVFRAIQFDSICIRFLLCATVNRKQKT